MGYKYNIEKRIEHLETLNISKENLKHIQLFIEDQAALGNSKARQIKYLSILGKLAEMINYNFDKATKDDIKKICSKINNSNLSEWTKHDYLLTLKVLYKFLRNTEEGYPTEVKWIKPKKAHNHKKLPRDLITVEDTKKLANNTNNSRDRSIILTLYETGGRISELLGLKIRDVEFDKYGALITFPDNGKTGARKVRIIASAPSISHWLQHHPTKNNRDAFLFCGLWNHNRGLELNYRHVNDFLKETGVKAGIDKPMNPHHFRHSRATELAKKLTEAQLCSYMGWVIGSKEAAIYVHLSGRDTDKAILEMYDLIEEEKEESKLKPIECPRCGIINDAAAKFCSGCSLGLDEKRIMEYDQQVDETGKSIQNILEDPYLSRLTLKQLLPILQKLQDKDIMYSSK